MRWLFVCVELKRFLSLAVLLLLPPLLLLPVDDVGLPSFLRWSILLTIVSLFRLATVDAIAATVVCDVVGIYVGLDLLRVYEVLTLFRVLTLADDSVGSVISFDCVGFDFFCSVSGGRRNPGRYCGRVYRNSFECFFRVHFFLLNGEKKEKTSY